MLATLKHPELLEPHLCHHPPPLSPHDADLDDNDLLNIRVKMLKRTITTNYPLDVEKGDTVLHRLCDADDPPPPRHRLPHSCYSDI